MNNKKINIEQISEIKEEQPWMMTYADMMTLLFAFFVLLYSMSSPDPVKMSQIQDAMEKKAGKPGSLQSLSEIQTELEKIVNELNIENTTDILSDPRGLVIDMGADMCFISGSTDLLDDLRRFLDKSKHLLNQKGDFRMIMVEGHTDSDPIPQKLQNKFPTNWELSAARAANVVNYLIDKGVNSGRLQASGYADRWPRKYNWEEVRGGKITEASIKQANMTREEKSQNRRIRIVIKGDSSVSNQEHL